MTNPIVQFSLNLKPFGIRLRPVDFRADHFAFRGAEHEVPKLLAAVRLAHAMSTPDAGRVMPRWMIVDLVLMPSAVLLALAGPEHLLAVARDLERDGADGPHRDSRDHAAALRDLLRLADELGYTGPLPVAGYAAIPTSRPGVWLGGSLWWSLVPGQRLGYSVRRIALECYQAQREVGVTQFIDNAGALRAQNDFGKLRVTHANLAVHSRPGTFVYDVDLQALPLDGSPVPATLPPDGAYPLDPADLALPDKLGAIQQEIKGGASYYLAAPPRDHPGAWPVIYADGRRQPEPEPSPGRGCSPDGSSSEDGWFTKGIRSGDPYKACIISNTSMFEFLDLAPFGIPLEKIDICASEFNAEGCSHEIPKLIDMLNRAIALSYAESGLGTPKWAMVELALMPSAVLVVLAGQDHLKKIADELKHEPVIAQRRTRLIPLAEDDLNRLRNAHSLLDLLQAADDSGYKGPLPVAGYAAAPTPQHGRWVGWSLWSLVPGKKLGYTVKRLALACYGVKTQTAVIQFRMARGLDVLTKFGTPEITTAEVRSHPVPNAFIYDMDVSDLPPDGSEPLGGRKDKANPPPKATRQLDPDDADLDTRLHDIQRDIDRGARIYLLPRSAADTKSPKVPIHRVFPLRRKILALVGAIGGVAPRTREAGPHLATMAPLGRLPGQRVSVGGHRGIPSVVAVWLGARGGWPRRSSRLTGRR